jgi:hypothetical protein
MNAHAISRRRGAFAFIVIYLVAYLLASTADLASTSLGLRRPGASEKNVFATTDGAYAAARAWALTAAGAFVMVGCVVYALRNADRVEERWLRQPVRSFGKLYLNPFSQRSIGVTPLHLLSLALGFVVMRLLAAMNNLLVYFYGFGPIGELIKAISPRTSALAGFAIVAGGLFVLVTLGMSRFAVKLLRSWRSAGASAGA